MFVGVTVNEIKGMSAYLIRYEVHENGESVFKKHNKWMQLMQIRVRVDIAAINVFNAYMYSSQVFTSAF